MCRFYIVLICNAVGDPYTCINRGRFGIPLTGLSPPHFCACPKPGSVFNNLTIYRLYFLLLYIAPLSRYLKFYTKLDCSEVYTVVLYREKGGKL
jgi:hypothetical protein